MPLSTPARAAVRGTTLELALHPKNRVLSCLLSSLPTERAVPNTPADRDGASVMTSSSCLSSPSPVAVGHPHLKLFEACSGFTYYGRRICPQPPKATFVTRLRSRQLPSKTLRQLPDLIDIYRVEPSSHQKTRANRTHTVTLYSTPIGDPKFFDFASIINANGGRSRGLSKVSMSGRALVKGFFEVLRNISGAVMSSPVCAG